MARPHTTSPAWSCDVCNKPYSTHKEAAACEARHFVREEVKTGKYPQKQAVAIGLSRARRAGVKVPRKK